MRTASTTAILVLSLLGACTSGGGSLGEESTAAPDPTSRSTTASPATTSLPSTLPTTSTPAVTTSTDVAATTTTTTTVDIADVGITRPVFPDDICQAISASEGETIDGVTFFTLVSDGPIPVQIIAEPGTTAADPFALVERLPGAGLGLRGEVTEINGNDVGIKTFDNGNGEAIWHLDDNTWGYLRSRGLNNDDIAEIIGSLAPRPLDSPFPGFSIDGAPEVQRFQTLHEQLNTEITGIVHSSECIVADTEFHYLVGVVEGDPTLQYGAVIDRPVPAEVAAIDDRVIVISGIPDGTAPRIADILDADADVWENLLGRPPVHTQDSVERTEAILVGQDIIISVSDITDPDVADSSLRLRLVVEDGVSFLQIGTDGLVLHPDAEYQMLTINGRPNSRVTALVGPTLGARVGETSLPEPFIVEIAITDATDNVLQVSETIRLIPQPG